MLMITLSIAKSSNSLPDFIKKDVSREAFFLAHLVH